MYQPTLSTMTIGASGVKQFQNISYAILSGAELGIVYKPAKTVQIVSTFKYNYGADNNKTPLPLIAPLKNITSIRKEIKRWNLLAETEMAILKTV
jgi:iron complex outermembrane receptor protein